MIHRLSISAFFSIAIHAMFMLIMAGMVLFPTAFVKPVTQLEVILASRSDDNPQDQARLEADQAQKGERMTERTDQQVSSRMQRKERPIHTTGNAQWAVRPGLHNQTAWEGLRDKPLRHRTVSAATHEARDAAYLARWRNKVETFGTSYYQNQIKRKPLWGEVRILVSIGPEGQLLGATVRQSSGDAQLDAMAMEILNKTAPFDPLPAEILTDTDVLEIMRTWKFSAREGLRSR